jgi:uncharacterized repeat protein (TIGR02543 family)
MRGESKMHHVKKAISLLTLTVLMFSTILPAYASTTYRYDSLGRLTGIAYTSGQTVSYTYDTMGNITNVVSTAAELIDGFIVEFDANGGFDPPLPISVSDGGTLLKPSKEPTMDGYHFKGWYREAIGYTPWNFLSDTVTDSITLYAKWEAENPQYATIIVIHKHINGTILHPEEHLQAEITLPYGPYRPYLGFGYEFLGFDYSRPDTIMPQGSANSLVNGGEYYIILLYGSPGQALTSHTVTFNSNGGMGTPYTTLVPNGHRVTPPGNPVMEGYIFKGWYREAIGYTPWNFTSDTVSDDIMLYAKWEAENPKYATIIVIHEHINGTILYQEERLQVETTLPYGPYRPYLGFGYEFLRFDYSRPGTIVPQGPANSLVEGDEYYIILLYGSPEKP